MIYTVTLNPSIDYHLILNKLRPNQLNISNSSYFLAGGKGINVATVLTNLGHECKNLGFVGGFTGQQLINMLNKQGLTNDFIMLDEGVTRINVKIKADKETELNASGPLIKEADVKRLLTKLDQTNDNDYFVLSGSVPLGLTQNIYVLINDRLKDKKIRICIDTRGKHLQDCLAYHPFLIKPNLQELQELFQTKITNEKQLITYMHKLQAQGAQHVLVSLGKDGAYLLSKDHYLYQGLAPLGKLISSVGSGDAMVAGFISAMINDHDNAETALQTAIAAGSASAFSQGLAPKEAIDDLIDQVIIKKIK